MLERNETTDISLIRENPSEYEFINPILLIDNSQVEFEEFKPLQEIMEKEVQKAIDQGLAGNVSIYFRDLDTSKWTGVNENVSYAPASMIKLVTLIAYLNIAQEDPDILRQQVYFKNMVDTGQYYRSPILPEGHYSVRQLLSHMIVESDNDAMDILNKYRPEKFLEVYGELGLPKPLSKESDDFMSAIKYSRLFRALYSSTYLSRPYSEEALKLLSQTKFDKGLVAGVPSSITVAHKFGEHTVLDPNNIPIERELHDCGIIYYPEKPYLLCVMTKGKDFSKLENVISSISATVYREISKAD